MPKNNVALHEYLFGEDQSRYIIEVNKKHQADVTKILENNNVYYDIIGITQKNNLCVENEFKVEISELANLNKLWFKNYFKDK